MSRLPAPVAAARRAVREHLTSRLDAGTLAPGDLVLVACSGGADSLALAAATAFVAPRLRLRAGAVSVDHGLQPGSAAVSERAAATCSRLGLDPSFVETADGGARPGGPAGGPEALARQARYGALRRAAEREGARCVLLGHTMDDQAETVLLGLARGAGTRSLAGMPTSRDLFGRPFLRLRRAEAVAVCDALGLEAWQDPTNAADGPLRTASGEALPRAALRERALPALSAALGQDVTAALARTADLARADADLLDGLADDLFHRAAQAAVASMAPAGGGAPPHPVHRTGDVRAEPGSAVGHPLELDVGVLAAAHPALRTRALRRAARAAGAPDGALAHVHVREVDALVTAWHGQGPLQLPGPTEVLRRCGRLVFRAGSSSSAPAEQGRDEQE